MSKWIIALSDRIRSQGAAAVARELGVPRQAILSVVAGCARDGTTLLVMQRFSSRAVGGTPLTALEPGE